MLSKVEAVGQGGSLNATFTCNSWRARRSEWNQSHLMFLVVGKKQLSYLKVFGLPGGTSVRMVLLLFTLYFFKILFEYLLFDNDDVII